MYLLHLKDEPHYVAQKILITPAFIPIRLHNREQLNTNDQRHPEMGAFFHIQIQRKEATICQKQLRISSPKR